MGVFGGFLAVMHPDVSVDVLHRSWTIEGDHCGDVPEVVRLQRLDVSTHPRAFKLEHVCGLAGSKQGKGGRVIQRDVGKNQPRAAVRFDQFYCSVKDG